MLALTLSVFAFTSCEDVPAPYATPEVDNGGVYIDQSFASSLSPFVSYLAEGTPEGMHWTNAYSSAVCTGSYKEEGASARTNHAGTAWLVGPTVDLSGASKIRVSFDQAVAYERTDGIADHHEFLVSTDYVEGNDPSTATWQKLNITFSSASHSGGNFDFEQTGLNLDPSLLVENVTFAFRYTSTEANASTWEVKNLLVMEGEYTAPTDGGEVVAYTKATGITAGQQYVFVAKDGDAYVAAAAKDGNYGYLNKADVELVDGTINVKDEQKFTFEQAEGGYYIKDANGKYLYMTGTYNSFNFSADVPAEGGVWTVNFTDNGVHVVNVAMQKTIQYSSQYGSWGAYATVTNILPELYTGGETGGESGEGGQGGGQTSGDHGTTQADPLTVAEALTIINGLADGATTDTEYFIKGKTTADGSTFYFNATYGQCNYYISADGSETNTIYVYNGLGLNNEKFTAKPENWGKGSEVLIKGKLQKYVKDSKVTPEIARGNYVVSVTPATPGESGGDSGEGGQTTDTNVTKSVSDATITLTTNNVTAGSETITCTLNTYGWENQSLPPTVTLTDGTTIVFAKADGTTDPKYYVATNGVRLYAKNTITITGHKPIAKVVLECDAYNGTNYVGNAELYGNVSGSVFTIVNDYAQTSGGVQLRVKTITITYQNVN